MDEALQKLESEKDEVAKELKIVKEELARIKEKSSANGGAPDNVALGDEMQKQQGIAKKEETAEKEEPKRTQVNDEISEPQGERHFNFVKWGDGVYGLEPRNQN